IIARHDHGHRTQPAIGVVDAGHAAFLSEKSNAHDRGLASISEASAYILIVISTPAGKLSFFNSSTVFEVGSIISSKRLWVRISNWSIDFLSTCGERLTVNFSINVGSGMGPATRAPVRFAVSTISTAD